MQNLFLPVSENTSKKVWNHWFKPFFFILLHCQLNEDSSLFALMFFIFHYSSELVLVFKVSCVCVCVRELVRVVLNILFCRLFWQGGIFVGSEIFHIKILFDKDSLITCSKHLFSRRKSKILRIEKFLVMHRQSYIKKFSLKNE